MSFLARFPVPLVFFQGQRWHWVYKYDTWPLLSTNPPQIFTINQKSSVAISFCLQNPICTFFDPKLDFLVSNREKNVWGGIFLNKSLKIDLSGNSKRTQSETKRTKRTPKRTQSETKRTKRTPKRTQSETKRTERTFSPFSWLFLKMWKIAIFCDFWNSDRHFNHFLVFIWSGRANQPHHASSVPQFVLFLGRGRLRIFFNVPGCLLLLCVCSTLGISDVKQKWAFRQTKMILFQSAKRWKISQSAILVTY